MLKHIFLFSFIASFLLLIYEVPLISMEGNRYVVSSYHPPEELVKSSGIYVLGVNTTEVLLEEGLEEQDFLELNSHSMIFDINQVTNIHRYANKTIALIQLIGINLEVDYVHQMSMNVNAYLSTGNIAIDEFLSRNNVNGNSAGLALVLSSLIEQEEVKNVKTIGVTGAISKTGEVIEIGQVKEKVLSANKINLPYIILPLGNLEEGNEVVESLNLPIEVIGVQTVNDAIQKINELNEEK